MRSLSYKGTEALLLFIFIEGRFMTGAGCDAEVESKNARSHFKVKALVTPDCMRNVGKEI